MTVTVAMSVHVTMTMSVVSMTVAMMPVTTVAVMSVTTVTMATVTMTTVTMTMTTVTMTTMSVATTAATAMPTAMASGEHFRWKHHGGYNSEDETNFAKHWLSSLESQRLALA